MQNLPYPDFDKPPSLLNQVRSLQNWGALLLRGCFAPEPLLLWRSELEALYAAADQALEAGTMPQAIYARCYQYGHLAADAWPRQGQFARELLRNPLLHPLLQHYCGSQPALPTKSMLPRR